MKIKFIIKCFECNVEHKFEYDTNDPYVFCLDTDTHLGVLEVEVEDEYLEGIMKKVDD